MYSSVVPVIDISSLVMIPRVYAMTYIIWCIIALSGGVEKWLGSPPLPLGDKRSAMRSQ